jgi:hypothetical protein
LGLIVSSDGASKVRGYAHVVKEDLVNKNLLFVGTELGLRISRDGGRNTKGGDLPSVAVRDIVIHPRDHDLVIATHGRGIWIVDDISPLRALASDTLSKDIAFLSARPSAQMIQAGGGWANGDAAFVGDNSPNEAVVTYYQKKRHIFGDLQIEVFDAKGESVGTIPASKRRGLNRVRWSMRMPAPRVPTAASIAGGATVGPRLLPGTYTVKMTKDKSVFTTQLQVVTDPRSKHTAADRRAQFDLSMKLYKLLGEMTTTVERINAVRLALNDRAAKAAGDAALQNKLQAASEQVDELRKKFVATREGGAITGEERLREYLANLYGDVNSYEGKPSQTQMERADALGRKLTDVTTSFNTWMAREMSGVNSALKQKNLEEIKNP